MKRSKETVIALALVVFIFLTACQQSETTTTPETTDQEQQEQSESETDAGDTQETTEEEISWRPEETITLSVYTNIHDTLSAGVDDVWFWTFFSDKYDIDFDVTQISSSALLERKNLMFASNQLPDILIGMGLNNTELVRYGQIENQLIDINPYISDELTPNLLERFDSEPVSYAVSLTPDGGLYSLPFYAQENDEGSVPRIFINDTWLEAVDLPMPTTLDEFYNVLLSFKENNVSGLDETIPLGGGFAASNPETYILSGLGFITNSYDLTTPAIRDGKVDIPAASELYVEFVTFMKKLYDNELINRDYYTIDETQTNAQMSEGKVGVYTHPPYLTRPEKEEYLQWSALVPPTSEHNDQKVWAGPIPFSVGTLALASTIEYPEAALNFLDYFYSTEGALYAWEGPVKDSPDTLGLVDGWYINEEGQTIFAAVENNTFNSGYDYVLGAVAPSVVPFGNRSDVLSARRKANGLEPLERVFDLDSGDQAYRKTVVENIMPHVQTPYPRVFFTEEQSTRLSDLTVVLQDFVSSETAKFVLGQNDINSFDRYFSDLQRVGIDEYIELYQQAYESYLDNLNQ